MLSSLQTHSSDRSYTYERLYRNLYNRELFALAYQNIYASQGNMTKGSDGKTIDAMSLNRIDGIIASLKDLSTNKEKMTFRGCKAEDFLVCLMGDAALNAESANSFQSIYSNIEQTIANNRISISGVDADEEAANMINYQNAYNLSS